MKANDRPLIYCSLRLSGPNTSEEKQKYKNKNKSGKCRTRAVNVEWKSQIIVPFTEHLVHDGDSNGTKSTIRFVKTEMNRRKEGNHDHQRDG